MPSITAPSVNLSCLFILFSLCVHLITGESSNAAVLKGLLAFPLGAQTGGDYVAGVFAMSLRQRLGIEFRSKYKGLQMANGSFEKGNIFHTLTPFCGLKLPSSALTAVKKWSNSPEL
ncbi:hypothetical protein KIL84_016710 [Mauremys mutica]|uniref:Uncharacterized protein n=1 Tax=Mauremys mutica TaxID=74926 RepID=A0A9D3X4U7_9SAUR|nr:hypothetical protein KIL84_016710 [Mauremys mutica]